MPVIETIQTKGVPVHVFTDEVEDSAREQLITLAESGIPKEYVAAMPDVHWGMGSTIGSVFAADELVCPNAVGVDIGCGIGAIPITNLHKDDLSAEILRDIHTLIKERVPTGFSSRESPLINGLVDKQPHSDWLGTTISGRTWLQAGTLGGGNHFIELTRDEYGGVWIMLHSGSRNIGKVTADHYNQLAMERAKFELRVQKVPANGLNTLLIDSPEGSDYLMDMEWCQAYALLNRSLMLDVVATIVTEQTGAIPNYAMAINVHHNFCRKEGNYWITRKGATYAGAGHIGVIPGSMGTGSFIVEGLGNPLSWESCSHGAGRRMSRTAAKANIEQSAFELSMEGIVCETVPELRDEAPAAYKDLDKVMEFQSDLVRPVHRLLPLLNVKGIDSGHRRKGK